MPVALYACLPACSGHAAAGAGGFDLILNPAAAGSLRLDQGTAGDAKEAAATTQIKGIGGGGQRLPAQRCQLAEARLGPATFSPAAAVFHTGGDGGLVLSRHTSGIVCAGLLGRCSLLLDYPRLRMAVLAGPVAQEGLGGAAPSMAGAAPSR